MQEYNNSINLIRNIDDFDEFLFKSHTFIDRLENFLFKSNEKPQGLVHKSAVIHPTAIVDPDVSIEEDVIIGPYCYIKNMSFISKGCILGYNVEISASVLLTGVKISHSACITNSIIGQNSNLGYNFVTASRNLLSGKITIYYKNNFEISLAKHHGAVLGQNIQAGVNISIMPGASIGPNTIILPNSCVSGYVKPNTKGFISPKYLE